MKKIFYSIILFLSILIVACSPEGGSDEDHAVKDTELNGLLDAASGGQGSQFYKFPASYSYDSIPQDPNNPITSEKVLLGQKLFHETALGIEAKMPSCIQTFSCASCHAAASGFQANRIQGLGDGGMGFGTKGEGRSLHPDYNEVRVDAQAIRTPSALNSAYQKNMLWNGQFGATGLNTGTESQWTANTPLATNHLGFEGVETQAIAGLTVHRMKLIDGFIQNTLYKTLFDAAFPADIPQERYSLLNAGLAIAAYERTLLATQAPFQEWLKGDVRAMTLEQKEGAILFFGKAGCADCHNSPALNDMDFHALGMNDLYQETSIETFKTAPDNGEIKGRGGFTGNPQDDYKFKTPQLYNLKDSPFYGHGGSFRSVEEIIRYKNTGTVQNENVDPNAISPLFLPLGLTDEEITNIADFIKNALYDPELMRFQPSSLPSGFCFPNNDPVSKSDLNCN